MLAAAGQAWEAFCGTLLRAGEEVLRQTPPGDELDGAEGFRYLGRLVRSSLESAFEASGPETPRLEPMYAARTSVAQRNPDQVYLRAALSARHEYRIRGRRGSGGLLSFVTRTSGLGGAEEGLTGFLDDGDLACAEDGTFEVAVGTVRRPGNWLAMARSTDLLMVRELFSAPQGAVPSVMTIERRDGAPEEELLSAAQVVRRLAQAGSMVTGLLERFGPWAERAAQRPNQLWNMDELLGPGEILRVGGSPSIDYRLGYWEVEPEQALVLEVPPSPGDRWSFQLMNYWQENLNLPWSGSNINAATARSEAGGSARLVIAGRDPGSANWVDTAGHRHGVMLFRWFGSPGDRPRPETRLVPLDQVPSGDAGAGGTDRRQQVAPGYLAPRIG